MVCIFLCQMACPSPSPIWSVCFRKAENTTSMLLTCQDSAMDSHLTPKKRRIRVISKHRADVNTACQVVGLEKKAL